MADIELVIKISEDDLKEVKEDTYSGTPFENRVFSAIANGTQLPKGHGDLKDADKLKHAFINAFIKWCVTMQGNNFTDADIVRIINNSQTIIEADKENK